MGSIFGQDSPGGTFQTFFRGEDYYVPSDRKLRLNCFGIIDRNSSYDGFTTTETINSDRIIEYFDDLSFRIRKKTVIVLDNAGIHWAKKVMCYRVLWEKRGLFIFFLPPYSQHLNLAETLWRILKGKWIKPQDYIMACGHYFDCLEKLVTFMS